MDPSGSKPLNEMTGAELRKYIPNVTNPKFLGSRWLGRRWGLRHLCCRGARLVANIHRWRFNRQHPLEPMEQDSLRKRVFAIIDSEKQILDLASIKPLEEISSKQVEGLNRTRIEEKIKRAREELSLMPAILRDMEAAQWITLGQLEDRITRVKTLTEMESTDLEALIQKVQSLPIWVKEGELEIELEGGPPPISLPTPVVLGPAFRPLQQTTETLTSAKEYLKVSGPLARYCIQHLQEHLSRARTVVKTARAISEDKTLDEWIAQLDAVKLPGPDEEITPKIIASLDTAIATLTQIEISPKAWELAAQSLTGRACVHACVARGRLIRNYQTIEAKEAKEALTAAIGYVTESLKGITEHPELRSAVSRLRKLIEEQPEGSRQTWAKTLMEQIRATGIEGLPVESDPMTFFKSLEQMVNQRLGEDPQRISPITAYLHDTLVTGQLLVNPKETWQRLGRSEVDEARRKARIYPTYHEQVTAITGRLVALFQIQEVEVLRRAYEDWNTASETEKVNYEPALRSAIEALERKNFQQAVQEALIAAEAAAARVVAVAETVGLSKTDIEEYRSELEGVKSEIQSFGDFVSEQLERFCARCPDLTIVHTVDSYVEAASNTVDQLKKEPPKASSAMDEVQQRLDDVDACVDAISHIDPLALMDTSMPGIQRELDEKVFVELQGTAKVLREILQGFKPKPKQEASWENLLRGVDQLQDLPALDQSHQWRSWCERVMECQARVDNLLIEWGVSECTAESVAERPVIERDYVEEAKVVRQRLLESTEQAKERVQGQVNEILEDPAAKESLSHWWSKVDKLTGNWTDLAARSCDNRRLEEIWEELDEIDPGDPHYADLVIKDLRDLIKSYRKTLPKEQPQDVRLQELENMLGELETLKTLQETIERNGKTEALRIKAENDAMMLQVAQHNCEFLRAYANMKWFEEQSEHYNENEKRLNAVKEKMPGIIEYLEQRREELKKCVPQDSEVFKATLAVLEDHEEWCRQFSQLDPHAIEEKFNERMEAPNPANARKVVQRCAGQACDITFVMRVIDELKERTGLLQSFNPAPQLDRLMKASGLEVEEDLVELLGLLNMAITGLKRRGKKQEAEEVSTLATEVRKSLEELRWFYTNRAQRPASLQEQEEYEDLVYYFVQDLRVLEETLKSIEPLAEQKDSWRELERSIEDRCQDPPPLGQPAQWKDWFREVEGFQERGDELLKELNLERTEELSGRRPSRERDYVQEAAVVEEKQKKIAGLVRETVQDVVSEILDTASSKAGFWTRRRLRALAEKRGLLDTCQIIDEAKYIMELGEKVCPELLELQRLKNWTDKLETLKTIQESIEERGRIEAQKIYEEVKGVMILIKECDQKYNRSFISMKQFFGRRDFRGIYEDSGKLLQEAFQDVLRFAERLEQRGEDLKKLVSKDEEVFQTAIAVMEESKKLCRKISEQGPREKIEKEFEDQFRISSPEAAVEIIRRCARKASEEPGVTASLKSWMGLASGRKPELEHLIEKEYPDLSVEGVSTIEEDLSDLLELLNTAAKKLKEDERVLSIADEVRTCLESLRWFHKGYRYDWKKGLQRQERQLEALRETLKQEILAQEGFDARVFEKIKRMKIRRQIRQNFNKRVEGLIPNKDYRTWLKPVLDVIEEVMFGNFLFGDKAPLPPFRDLRESLTIEEVRNTLREQGFETLTAPMAGGELGTREAVIQESLSSYDRESGKFVGTFILEELKKGYFDDGKKLQLSNALEKSKEEHLKEEDLRLGSRVAFVEALQSDLELAREFLPKWLPFDFWEDRLRHLIHEQRRTLGWVEMDVELSLGFEGIDSERVAEAAAKFRISQNAKMDDILVRYRWQRADLVDPKRLKILKTLYGFQDLMVPLIMKFQKIQENRDLADVLKTSLGSWSSRIQGIKGKEAISESEANALKDHHKAEQELIARIMAIKDRHNILGIISFEVLGNVASLVEKNQSMPGAEGVLSKIRGIISFQLLGKVASLVEKNQSMPWAEKAISKIKQKASIETIFNQVSSMLTQVEKSAPESKDLIEALKTAKYQLAFLGRMKS